MLMHLGTTLGHGADGAGVETLLAPVLVAGDLPVGTTVFAIVEVAVMVIVETVLVTEVMALPLEVTTEVTGKVVTVSQVTIVVVLSGAVVTGPTDVGPAVHLGQYVDTDVNVTVEMVLVTEVTGFPLEVTTVVTGHVVIVSYVTTVVVLSGMETGPEEMGATPVGP